jgi:hypothetical protein
MKKNPINFDRRKFIKTTAVATTGLFAFSGFKSSDETNISSDENPYIIGPMEGYSLQIGTLVSMLNYNRQTVIDEVKSLTMSELDYLFDQKANTIGALILHLGATDKFYQINTFEGRYEFNESEKKIWQVAQSLGNEGRKKIKGQEVKYYLDMINEVRQKTLEELKKKDDKWLLSMDTKWGVNTYWKWFHVCEHESNHRGQITWLKRRLPGAKPGDD